MYNVGNEIGFVVFKSLNNSLKQHHLYFRNHVQAALDNPDNPGQ